MGTLDFPVDFAAHTLTGVLEKFDLIDESTGPLID